MVNSCGLFPREGPLSSSVNPSGLPFALHLHAFYPPSMICSFFFSTQPSIRWSESKELLALTNFPNLPWELTTIPQCLPSVSLHVCTQQSGHCLYALSGTNPLRPSVKRTEGLGPEPAGLDSV